MAEESLFLVGESGDVELEIRRLLAQRASTGNRRDRQILKLRLRELLDSLVNVEPSFANEKPQVVADSSDVGPMFVGEIGLIESQLRVAVTRQNENISLASVASAKFEIATLVELLKSVLLHEHPGSFSEAGSRVWGMVRSQNLHAIRAVDSLLVKVLRDPQTGHSVLHRAALVSNVDLITLLVVEKGCFVNAMSLSGQTPLHVAVDLENASVVKKLIELSADVSILDYSGKSPFHDAPKYLSDLANGAADEEVSLEGVTEIAFSDLHMDILVGQGATASVYSGTFEGKAVAIKLFTLCPRQDFLREVKILARLHHPHILEFHGACIEPPLMVTELCAGGSLFELLHDSPTVLLSVAEIIQYATQTVEAVAYLHAQTPQILHLDLKSKNLLLTNNSVRLADFGAARIVYGPAVFSEPSSVGTWWWMSPEALLNDEISPKSDMYSFGICMFELLCRVLPFQSFDLAPVTIAIKVSGGYRPEIVLSQRRVEKGDEPKIEALVAIMQKCWATDPADRPTALDVMHQLSSLLVVCFTTTSVSMHF